MEGDSSPDVSVAEVEWGQGPPEVDIDILIGVLDEGVAARGGGVRPDGQVSHGGSVRSQGSVPAFVGGGGRVGSVGSVASRSIQPTGNYFNESARRSRRDAFKRKVVCPRDKRGLQGSRDYCRTHDAATAALPELFGAAKHFRTKNSDGELSYKYKDIQSEYVGNLDKLKLFRKRIVAYDMYNPFMVPTWINPNAISVLARWGDRTAEAVDLFKHWSTVSLEHVCAWQRDTFDWCNSEEDLTSMEWVKEFLTNSCDINLVKRIDEKFDRLFEYEQGGITYVKIALDEMFTMSGMVVLSLQKYLKQFAQDGVAKVPNEDVRICAEQIVAVSARLAEVDALPHESAGQILEGFTRCSVPDFRDMHKMLITAENIRQIRAVGGKRDSTATLDAIKKLCSEAVDYFHVLNLSNKWNIPQGHRADAAVISCYNCGALDHTSDKCPKPRDEARIAKAKEARAKANPAGGRGGEGHGRGGGRSAGRGRGGGTNLRENSRGKWGGNDTPKNPGTNNSGGIEKQNGEWKMNCKSCGWNATHTSGYHGEWSRNQSSFQLPATHIFWNKSGATPAASTPAPPAATAGGRLPSRGQLSGLINRHRTETDDGAFSSFLSEFEGLLN